VGDYLENVVNRRTCQNYRRGYPVDGVEEAKNETVVVASVVDVEALASGPVVPATVLGDETLADGGVVVG
jgi:hypothetical protein